MELESPLASQPRFYFWWPCLKIRRAPKLQHPSLSSGLHSHICTCTCMCTLCICKDRQTDRHTNVRMQRMSEPMASSLSKTLIFACTLLFAYFSCCLKLEVKTSTEQHEAFLPWDGITFLALGFDLAKTIWNLLQPCEHPKVSFHLLASGDAMFI